MGQLDSRPDGVDVDPADRNDQDSYPKAEQALTRQRVPILIHATTRTSGSSLQRWMEPATACPRTHPRTGVLSPGSPSRSRLQDRPTLESATSKAPSPRTIRSHAM